MADPGLGDRDELLNSLRLYYSSGGSAIDRVVSMAQLRDHFGMSNTMIADRVGISVAQVGFVLRVHDGPRPLLDAVKRGHVSITEASDLIARFGSKATDVLHLALKISEVHGKNKVTAKFSKMAAEQLGLSQSRA